MASTYSDLKIELIGTGEQVGTWGNTTNTNLGTALEEAIVESADVAFSSADVTLTLTNTNSTQAARHLRLNLTGTSGGARNLILGSGCQIDKPYIINNGLADTVTVKNTAGTGIAVPAGKTMWVYNNGTNVVEVMNHATSFSAGSMTLGTALPVASGGTGATTLTANNVILGNGTSAVQFVAPGSTGNVLTSNGTTWTSTSLPSAGTVTSVGGTGTVDGVTLSGSVTTSGNLSLSGSVSIAGSQVTSGNIAAARITSALNAGGSPPIYACRAWVNVSGFTSPGSIRASGNISSVTKIGMGNYTMNFSIAMPDANYSVNVSLGGNTGYPYLFINSLGVEVTPTTSSFNVLTNSINNSGQQDFNYVNISVFR